MGFCARLAGRCPAPASVMLFGFCSGLDKHRWAFGFVTFYFFIFIRQRFRGWTLKRPALHKALTLYATFLNTLMVQGFNKILIFFLLAYLHLFATSVSGQKVYKDNFTKIAKSYLEYATSNPYEKFTHHKLVLDTSTTVFIISTIPFAKDSFLFVIKFWRTDILTDLKYKNVYSLANYKLVIVGDEDKSRIISNLFKKRQYENLNKGKKVNGVSYEDFQKWTFLMNKNYEILQAISGFPQQSEFIELLKKSKVSFAKNFTLVPE